MRKINGIAVNEPTKRLLRDLSYTMHKTQVEVYLLALTQVPVQEIKALAGSEQRPLWLRPITVKPHPHAREKIDLPGDAFDAWRECAKELRVSFGLIIHEGAMRLLRSLGHEVTVCPLESKQRKSHGLKLWWEGQSRVSRQSVSDEIYAYVTAFPGASRTKKILECISVVDASNYADPGPYDKKGKRLVLDRKVKSALSKKVAELGVPAWKLLACALSLGLAKDSYICKNE